MVDFAKTYDVVIIGGGPVGLGLAIELGQRGHSVAVAERTTALHHIPKGQNLTQRTMEHFHFWGCEDAIRAARTVPRDYAIGGMTSYRTLLSGFHYEFLPRALVRPYYFTDNERLPQYATEAVLRARAAQVAGVDIGYGLSCEAVMQDPEGATAIVRDKNGGEHRVTGRYLVGADGSNSTVRQAVGITQTRTEHDKKMVLLVFRSRQLHEHLQRYPGKQFYCVLNRELQGYWLFFGRVDLGTTWFFHAPVPDDATAETFDFHANLERAIGAEIDVELDHIGFWDLRIALADTYRADNVFIAGDACHSHPPYGGYGVNTGLEDARNLGWKLSARLQGWGGEALLDSHNEERQPVFRATADHFIERFIREDRDFLNAHSPEQDGEAAFRAAWEGRAEGASEVTAFAPNYDGSSIVWGSASARPSAVGTHEFRARAGHHLAPRALDNGANAYDKLGQGFTLFVHDDLAGIAPAFSDAARQAGVPLEVVTAGPCEAFSDWQAAAVLVRPDNYVAWAGADMAADAGAILARCVGNAAGA